MWCILNFLLFSFGIIQAETILATICFGNTQKLHCEDGYKLEIHGAFYKPLSNENSICTHVNKSSSQCHVPRLETFIRNDCHGKNKCVLTYENKHGAQPADCRPSMYLNILYQCVEQSKMKKDDDIVHQQTTSAIPTMTKIASNFTPVVVGGTEVTGSSGYLSLARLLLELRLASTYWTEHDREMILCIMLSIAAGMFLFILVVACMMCRSKCCKKSGQFDVEDGGKSVGISAPIVPKTVPPSNFETVLVTRQNGVSLSETTLSSDSTLTTHGSKNDHHVISTIRRTHSIDEGTQTDNEDVESMGLQPHTLSLEEQKELGFLVNSMNFYNRRLDDDFYTEPKKYSQRRKPEPAAKSDQQKFFYSQPRDTNPLLKEQSSSEDTYSPTEDYSSDERSKFLPKKKYNARNPSEVSHETNTTSVSSDSIDLYSPEAIFNGDTLRRNHSTPRTPRTPKLGVRGDGFDFIQNGVRVKT